MSKKKKTVLYMHTGSGNHGCEAIIRTTSKLLKGPEGLVLWSLTATEDAYYGAANRVEKVVSSEEIKKYTGSYFEAAFRRKVLRESGANMKIFLRDLFRGNVAVSVGGDNYCYPWSAEQACKLDREIRKYCRYSVLWGCSVDPEAITPEVKEDLLGFDLITAREQITYNLLRSFHPNTVQVADPAFLLERTDLPLPEKFLERNTVGINISPMIMEYGTAKQLILDNYCELIKHILRDTDMNVCLIPHVVWEYNNDLIPINVLYETFKDSGRVCKIEDGNCTELKGYIARCRFFVGARTHATIAAYSSCVPTLVVGYSVKSRGIARDLFGTDEGYVVPVQNLRTQNDLANSFMHFIDGEDDQRQTLQAVIPEYKNRARSAADSMCKLLNN